MLEAGAALVEQGLAGEAGELDHVLGRAEQERGVLQADLPAPELERISTESGSASLAADGGQVAEQLVAVLADQPAGLVVPAIRASRSGALPKASASARSSGVRMIAEVASGTDDAGSWVSQSLTSRPMSVSMIGADSSKSRQRSWARVLRQPGVVEVEGVDVQLAPEFGAQRGPQTTGGLVDPPQEILPGTEAGAEAIAKNGDGCGPGLDGRLLDGRGLESGLDEPNQCGFPAAGEMAVQRGVSRNQDRGKLEPLEQRPQLEGDVLAGEQRHLLNAEGVKQVRIRIAEGVSGEREHVRETRRVSGSCPRPRWRKAGSRDRAGPPAGSRGHKRLAEGAPSRWS